MSNKILFLKNAIFTFALTALIASLFLWLLYAQTNSLLPSDINKTLASTSLTLLGIALLLGPLARLYDFLDSFLHFRKAIGIMAFFLATIHTYLTLFPLARSGPLGFITNRPYSAVPGLIALSIFIFLFIISFETIKHKLGIERWWHFQFRGARLAAIFILIHVTVLKSSGWVTFITQGQGLPPSGLLVALFSLFVLLTRVTELLPKPLARALVPVWFVATLSFSVFLFLVH